MQEMDEAGVDMGVVPVRTADGVSNDDVLGLLEDYPGRFIVMAGIDPTTGILNALQDIDKYTVNIAFIARGIWRHIRIWRQVNIAAT